MAAAFSHPMEMEIPLFTRAIYENKTLERYCSSASMRKQITSSRFTLDVSIVSRDEM
jgi:hypothetical protein